MFTQFTVTWFAEIMQDSWQQSDIRRSWKTRRKHECKWSGNGWKVSLLLHCTHVGLVFQTN